MPEKIFDIIPVQKKVTKEEEVFEEEKVKKERHFDFKKYIFYFFVFLFLFSGIWAYFSFSIAQIEIWIKTERLDFSETVLIDTNIDYININDRVIQGKLFIENASGIQNFPSSGKATVQESATGIIRVYNNHSTEDQSLLDSTRFVSSDGKLFRSLKREVIPGGKYSGGKLEPGYVDIEVKAAEAGEDYNIGPATFSIPGFAGTAKYIDFYGKSFEPMKGGFQGEASVVLKEDIETAKNLLHEGVLKSAYVSALSAAEKEGFVLQGENIISEKNILKEEIFAEAGDIVSNFDYELEMELKFPGFKKADMEVLAEDFITRNILEGQKIKRESMEISYQFLEVDESGRIALNVTYSAEIYSEVSMIEIDNFVLGKERETIKTNLASIPQIERIQINSWPLLRSKAPSQKEKVEIKINI
ncbi:MAG: hypothetical protein PHH17_00225 [Candidatus Pacebacteria bacterium]|nr:hypothetical protein [Candidatus Paceibacterota bacterium]MDD3728808.1 hypothetical protein [Candidatus Paceibacterota bacterium]MDD4201333.1 hypothetical protein [Candidatus Paceibacterota bacterium]MDD4467005.1 hypothetical protein [Candidatus Paceibacterota bacterium]MDD4897146.1 hypothetical protein [Candidatus Paceibacterota bacterium]